MIDFFASVTVALIVVMTLVIFMSNQRQARILKQMRLVMEDWYAAQMRDRRETFHRRIRMPDVLEWVGRQVNLTVVEKRRLLDNPPAIEFLTAEGPRLVLSPLNKRKLRASLRTTEHRRQKVAKLVEPLLGYRPGRVEILERSNATVHEWYEVEIETALQRLDAQWGEVAGLFFYVIPPEPVKEKHPLVRLDIDNLLGWFKTAIHHAVRWFRQHLEKVS